MNDGPALSPASPESHDALAAHRDALEARYARRVAARLSAQADALPHEVRERLRLAREQALERARASAPGRAQRGSRPGAPAHTGLGWWWRLAALAPGVALVAGLVLIQRHQDDEQLQVAAEIDAELLSDELPPVAYTDPGFAEFLKSPGS